MSVTNVRRGYRAGVYLSVAWTPLKLRSRLRYAVLEESAFLKEVPSPKGYEA
jgi:hypothetical protein